jgi:hypothetical protein
MIYTVNRIEFSDLPSDVEHQYYAYDASTLQLIAPASASHDFCRIDPSAYEHLLPVKRLTGEPDRSQRAYYLHLEIYDDHYNLWYVTFQLSQSAADPNAHFTVYNDSLFVFPSVGENLYHYSLAEKKCVDCHASHNRMLHQNGIEHPAKFWSFISEKGFLVLLSQALFLFNSEGLIWRVDTITRCPCCVCALDVDNGVITIREEAYFGFYVDTYDLADGRFLHGIEDWSATDQSSGANQASS